MPTLIDTIKTGIKFADAGYKDYSPKYRKKQKWKIAFHTFFNLKFAKKWFDFIQSSEFETVFRYRKKIYIKPFRPYISIKWNKNRKLKVILDTYRFLQEKGLLDKFLIDFVPVAEIDFNNEFTGLLKLEYDNKFRKEGELVLTFECNQCGGKIVSVSFSVEQEQNGKWICRVGCVQGLSRKKNFKLAQKLLFGMRPNSFIIFALQELIRNLSIEKIFAASNAVQANRKKHFINIQSIHKINFDYDKFYEDVGGKRISTDWFELPLTFKRKDINDIKSQKRNLYRKRYKLLDDVADRISSSKF